MSCNKRKRESVEADSNFLVPTEPFSDQYPKDKFTINDFKIITLDQFLDIFKGTISDGLSTYFIRYDIDGLYGDARLCAWLKINQKLYFAVFSVDNYMTEFFGENDDKKNSRALYLSIYESIKGQYFPDQQDKNRTTPSLYIRLQINPEEFDQFDGSTVELMRINRGVYSTGTEGTRIVSKILRSFKPSFVCLHDTSKVSVSIGKRHRTLFLHLLQVLTRGKTFYARTLGALPYECTELQPSPNSDKFTQVVSEYEFACNGIGLINLRNIFLAFIKLPKCPINLQSLNAYLNQESLNTVQDFSVHFCNQLKTGGNKEVNTAVAFFDNLHRIATSEINDSPDSLKLFRELYKIVLGTVLFQIPKQE